MSKIKQLLIKRAFTLFELILVIFIIGILYTIVGISFDRFFAKDKEFKFENLKELMDEYKSDKVLKLVCYRDCSRCVIFEDEKLIKEDVKLKLDDKLKVYAVDEFGELVQVEFSERYIHKDVEFPELEKVCFEYKLFPNGSNSSYVVYNFGKYYIFDALFRDVNMTDEEYLAKEYFLKRDYYPTSFGDYYEN